MEFNSNLEKIWIEKAKLLNKTIVLPEASFSERMVLAGIECAKQNICNIVFLTDSNKAFDSYNIKDIKNISIVNYLTSDKLAQFTNALYELRKDKGLTIEEAKKLLLDPVYFATMMLQNGDVDGLVAGAEISTLKTFKPALQIIKGKNKETKISSCFIMVNSLLNKTFVLSDCGMNINPTADEIAAFAEQSAETCRALTNTEPKVALLSYSTKGSAEGDSAIKMREANNIMKNMNLNFEFDGEVQFDAAVKKEVAELKCKDSCIKGDANVLIFPDLESGNIGYKIMNIFGGFYAYGPISQGMRKPVNDVSRGAKVNEIIITIAITCLQ